MKVKRSDHGTTGNRCAERRLIVNADDFGQTEGINAGIIECHRHGILTSATLMPNGAAFEQAVALSESHRQLGVGVHVNLLEGRPVARPSDVSSLVTGDGVFMSKYALLLRDLAGRLRREQLRREIDSQIERVFESGIMPTHVDSHRHIHAYPPFFQILSEAAARYGIGAIRLPMEPLRMRDGLDCLPGLPRTALLNMACRISRRILWRIPLNTTERFAGLLRTGAVTPPWLAEWIRNLPPGTVELMVHPGYCDHALLHASTRLKIQRCIEFKALIDDAVLQSVDAAFVELIHYGQLSRDLARPTAVVRDADRAPASRATDDSEA